MKFVCALSGHLCGRVGAVLMVAFHREVVNRYKGLDILV